SDATWLRKTRGASAHEHAIGTGSGVRVPGARRAAADPHRVRHHRRPGRRAVAGPRRRDPWPRPRHGEHVDIARRLMAKKPVGFLDAVRERGRPYQLCAVLRVLRAIDDPALRREVEEAIGMRELRATAI